METLTSRLIAYRQELALERERKRAHEIQAANAGQKAAIIEAKIAGIEEAAVLLGAEIDESSAKIKAKGNKRQRQLSGPWKDIMSRANAHGPSFSYDDLEDFAEIIGHTVGRDTLRSQMSGYKGAGLVEPAGAGRFRMTDAGRAAAGITEKSEELAEALGEDEEREPAIAAEPKASTSTWVIRDGKLARRG